MMNFHTRALRILPNGTIKLFLQIGQVIKIYLQMFKIQNYKLGCRLKLFQNNVKNCTKIYIKNRHKMHQKLSKTIIKKCTNMCKKWQWLTCNRTATKRIRNYERNAPIIHKMQKIINKSRIEVAYIENAWQLESPIWNQVPGAENRLKTIEFLSNTSKY